MTSIFDTNGRQTAVTIIEAGPCVVTQKKTVDTDGYNAVQIAFGDKKEKHTLLSEKNAEGWLCSGIKKKERCCNLH